MPGTRRFFVATLALGVCILAVPVFGFLTALPEIEDPAVVAGLSLWRASGCAGCHALFEHGGTYAPDLTRAVSLQSGTELARAMAEAGPAHRHLAELGTAEIDSLLTFLRRGMEPALAVGWPPPTASVTGHVPDTRGE